MKHVKVKYSVDFIPSRLKRLRISQGFSIDQLADFLNIDSEQYKMIEEGNVEISVIELVRLSEFYKVKVDYFINSTDDFYS